MLKIIDDDEEFETLLGKKIQLHGKILFLCKIRMLLILPELSEVMTHHVLKTNSVIVECAYFDPEIVIGKSTSYDINSEAAHKFERELTPLS